ncbi:hypothetical protein SAMN05444722_1682 [Rhodovulum sp. ES.010]|uniref:hypothetical protein n=1 Tax=Rhodovulum sp. ES.010 TaxID=1882821 RepID=UPI000926E1D7|nr:hypothetical protein [Rhodovulum sp. ES.010]SIO36373.1 hypothetical protein SAMN05444722_1682 [Rhodovulum sp. ES.010]
MDASGDLRVGLLVRCRFDSGDLAMFTGTGTVEWDGVTYIGTGARPLSVGESESTSQEGNPGLGITLAGLDPEILALAELEPIQRRRVTVLLGLFDAEGQIVDADVVFDGLADDLDSTDDPEAAETTLACEQRALDLARPRPFYYLPEDQQKRFPGDRFFDLVQAIQNREDTWGNA